MICLCTRNSSRFTLRLFSESQFSCSSLLTGAEFSLALNGFFSRFASKRIFPLSSGQRHQVLMEEQALLRRGSPVLVPPSRGDPIRARLRMSSIRFGLKSSNKPGDPTSGGGGYVVFYKDQLVHGSRTNSTVRLSGLHPCPTQFHLVAIIKYVHWNPDLINVICSPDDFHNQSVVKRNALTVCFHMSLFIRNCVDTSFSSNPGFLWTKVPQISHFRTSNEPGHLNKTLLPF